MRGLQLPLAVQLQDSASFDSFHSGPNSEAVSALRELREPVLLFGSPRSGRSHLLQAACRQHGGAYLPLKILSEMGAEILEGYDVTGRLFIDDIDAVCAQRPWCMSLVRLIDNLRANGHRYALTASAPPERLDIALPDLRTRLSQCAVVGLRPLDDADRGALLRLRAQHRGLDLPDDVLRWLLNTQARDAGSLLATLDRLDRASLSEKRRLTLPLAQRVLAATSERTTPG